LIDVRLRNFAVETKNWQDAKFTFNENSCTDLAGVTLKFLAKSKIMKRWAALTVLLYALALVLLTLPVDLVAFGNWSKNDSHHGLQEAIQSFYLNWGYWLWLAVLVAGQMLLLLLPINISERRLPARHPLKIPVIVTSFFLANLCFAGMVSLLCAIFKENGAIQDGGLGVLEFLDPLKFSKADNGWRLVSGMFTAIAAFWFIWAIIFRNFAKSDVPDALLKRSTRWLLRGSILELLIAVPSHVIVRRRDDCCAPAATFWGIATGISVMLLCFGPGVFFLFVERCRRLQPKSPATENPPPQN
jgi:hypothetical protein